MNKMLALMFCVIFFASSALLAESKLWSEEFDFDGSEIKENEVIMLAPSDKLAYGSLLADGNPQKIIITVTDKDKPKKKATLFTDKSKTAIYGTITWNYNDKAYQKFPVEDTYILTETITSDKETKTYTRLVNLLPEPIMFLSLALVCLFFLRIKRKSFLTILMLLSFCSAYSKAETSVTEVSCMQMWPFERSVIIDYTIQSDAADSFLVKFYGTIDNGETTFDLSEYGTVSKDGAFGIVKGTGRHELLWTPDESFFPLKKGKMKIQAVAEDIANYLILDLTDFSVSYLYKEHIGSWSDEYKTTKMVLRLIPPGTFIMGSPKNEKGRKDNETQHEVTLTRPFYIGVFEVTQKQYELITGEEREFTYEGDTRPADDIGFDDIRGHYVGDNWPLNNLIDDNSVLGILRTKTDLCFDLPTEAQWEYACRAGTTTAWNNGTDIKNTENDQNLNKLGRYWFNQEDGVGGYSEGTTAVGSYLPNAWGLYDMHGNAGEWCKDRYQKNLGTKPVTDPPGGYSDDYYPRGRRGGGYNGCHAYACRSAWRDEYANSKVPCFDYGFRLVLVLEKEKKEKEIIKESFEYELTTESDTTLPVFQTRFFGKEENGNEYLLSEIGKLEDDGAAGIVLGNGKHKVTWIPYDDNVELIGKLKLRVEYEDITDQAKYLVLNLESNKMRASMEGPTISNDNCRREEIWLRRIEPGTFDMGSPYGELGRYSDEDLHSVTLTKAFYIGVLEITMKQFEMIAGYNPSTEKYFGLSYPQDEISYDDIRGADKGSHWPLDRNVDSNSFIGLLRARAGNLFDLPTEAQWEYACRAGSNTSWNDGTSITNSVSDGNLNKLGRYIGNKNNYFQYSLGGSYLTNAWGLYDMHGNVEEWCLDWYGYYGGTVEDPAGKSTGSERVLRGGGKYSQASYCRSAFRAIRGYPNKRVYNGGFRIVIVP